MITVYTLDNSEKWDNIVRSFRNYDVYYLSGYVKAFQLNGDGKAILLYFETTTTRAINVVMRRDLADYKYFKTKLHPGELFDIVTPYGYGGFLVEGNEYTALQREYESFCRNEHIICEFVRFHPLLENWKGLENLYQENALGDTVYIDTRDKDIIWQNIISKNRNMIRKAQKSGLKVYWGRDPEIINPFMEIYNETMHRDQAEDYYYFGRDFYESILEDLKQNAMWFYAKMNKEIAAVAIFIFGNSNMHYHLSASREQYRGLASTNLVLYEAAVWAAENGYQKLHLGGGVGSGEDSLYKFKKAFNRGNNTKFYIGRRIFDHDQYEAMVRLRMESDPAFDPKTRYFPSYRG